MQVPSLGGEDPPGEGHSNPLQYSCLENPMDIGAWWATVHKVAKSQTSLGDQELFTDPLFQLHLWASQAVLVVKKNPPANAGDLSQEDPLEEEMATHSSILAWRIPWTEEPGGLQSIRSQRVGHD